MSSGAMKLKVVDSEKTSKLFLTNLKQNAALEKTLRDLEISEDTVVNRISSTQKVTYRRFQAKLQRSELMSARMRGDHEKITALRKETNKSGPVIQDDDEVNEVLKRIWRNGSGKMKRQPIFSSDGRRVKSAVTIRTIAPSHPPSETPSPKQSLRPNTAFAKIQSKQVLPKGGKVPAPQVRIQSAKSHRSQHSMRKDKEFLTGRQSIVDDDDDYDDDESQVTPKKSRPYTTLGIRRTSAYINSSMIPSARSNTSAADFLSNIDPFQKAQSERLEQHRQHIESANYNEKIKKFCKSLLPFTNDKGRFTEDYYYARLLSKKRGTLYNNFIPSDAELQRSTGNPNVRNLTMRRLNLDYSDILLTNKGDKENAEPDLSSDED